MHSVFNLFPRDLKLKVYIWIGEAFGETYDMEALQFGRDNFAENFQNIYAMLSKFMK